MGKTETKIEDRVLPLSVAVHKSALFFAQEHAKAKGDDFDVDIVTNIGGGFVATVRWKGEKDWYSYVITPHALVEAVLQAEKERRGG